MAKLAKTVVVTDPTTRRPTSLVAGSDLPEWAVGLVAAERLQDEASTSAPFPAPAGGDDGGGGSGDGDPVFDPEATVADILERVGNDAELAGRYLAAESAKGEDARKTLVERLTVISTPSGDQ